MIDAADVQPIEHHLKAAEYHELAASHHRDAVAHAAAGDGQRAAYHGEMARAAELYAAQFGEVATTEDRVVTSVERSTAHADADAVARQENEGGPAVAPVGRLPSRRRRLR
jgi:hypothetical protein